MIKLLFLLLSEIKSNVTSDRGDWYSALSSFYYSCCCSWISLCAQVSGSCIKSPEHLLSAGVSKMVLLRASASTQTCEWVRRAFILSVLKITCLKPLIPFSPPCKSCMRWGVCWSWQMAEEQTGPHKHAKKSNCITADQLVPGLGFSSACHCPAYIAFPITPWLGCLVTYLLERFPSPLSSL